jgi:outer membrane protein assembly factor BamB
VFRSFLATDAEIECLSLRRVIRLGGLVRTVLCDQKQGRAYVVVYREQTRQYVAYALDAKTGNPIWEQSVINGGYGAPALTESALVMPTRFTDVSALSLNDGSHLWTVETEARVRSPINAIDNDILFSSGGTVYRVDGSGAVTARWSHEHAFFYGSVDVLDGKLFTLGTLMNEAGASVAHVFAFSLDGSLIYQLPLERSPVVSADTSGIAWDSEIGFVGTSNAVIAFDEATGQRVWTAVVDGFAGRQVCTCYDRHLYYVTQNGIVGALNAKTGEALWTAQTADRFIVSPLSAAGSKLFALADGHLMVINRMTGEVIQKCPVGHSPYSMVSIGGNTAFVGGGEPPHQGSLLLFDMLKQKQEETYACQATLDNAFVESDSIDLLLDVRNANSPIVAAIIDTSVFGRADQVEGASLTKSKFQFAIPLHSTVAPGDFVLPLILTTVDGQQIERTIALHLDRKYPLPSKSLIKGIPEIVQERPNYSGAAVAAGIKALYGQANVSQSDLRQAVDATLEHSGYEPFQTWRLVLRRVLTSAATSANELPEFR